MNAWDVLADQAASPEVKERAQRAIDAAASSAIERLLALLPGVRGALVIAPPSLANRNKWHIEVRTTRGGRCIGLAKRFEPAVEAVVEGLEKWERRDVAAAAE